jgi:hypothetical protein
LTPSPATFRDIFPEEIGAVGFGPPRQISLLFLSSGGGKRAIALLIFLKIFFILEY